MKFDEIQNLKKEKILIKDDINYSKVMAVRLYTEGFIFTVKCIVLSLLYEMELYYEDNSSKILISYYNIKGKRKDQDYIIEKFKSIVGNYNELHIVRKICISKVLKKVVVFLKTVYKNRNLKVKFIENVKISALENYFENIFKKLQMFNYNEQLYISFCDSYLEENLFAQYFSNKKKITATLQHGQYRYIKKGYETTDVEAYLNFVSDYLFSWGEITKQELLKAGIQPNKILSVGALKEFSDRKIIRKSSLSNNFGVILNGETHSESNIKMIRLANEIANKYSLRYYIRPHPMNKLNKYIKYVDRRFYIGLINDKNEYAYQVDFSILHMTAVFVEMLSYNVPFFVLDDEWTEEIFKINLITFKDLQEFELKYNNFKNNKSVFLKYLDNEFLKFNCCKNDDELTANYINAIEFILSTKK